MSKIKCVFCNEKISSLQISDHISDCIVNYTDNKTGFLIEFIAQNSLSDNYYQLFAIVGSKCKFSHVVTST